MGMCGFGDSLVRLGEGMGLIVMGFGGSFVWCRPADGVPDVWRPPKFYTQRVSFNASI